MPPPRPQMKDMRSDPPFATNFGAGAAHSDHGRAVGGMDRRWRESKIEGISGGGPSFGPPPRSGPLRSAFIQNMGPDSVPRDAELSSFEGARRSIYTIDRPMGRWYDKTAVEARIERYQKIEALFDALDVDNSQDIPKREFVGALTKRHTIWGEFSKAEATALFDAIDQTKTGRITKAKFGHHVRETLPTRTFWPLARVSAPAMPTGR
eukprot:702807-Prymnesium_polylepis.2